MKNPVQFTMTLTAAEVLSLVNAVDSYHARLLRDRLETYGAEAPETLSEARARRVRDAVDAVAVPAALAEFEPLRAVP